MMTRLVALAIAGLVVAASSSAQTPRPVQPYKLGMFQASAAKPFLGMVLNDAFVVDLSGRS
jgi:hypothetical protein